MDSIINDGIDLESQIYVDPLIFKIKDITKDLKWILESKKTYLEKVISQMEHSKIYEAK